ICTYCLLARCGNCEAAQIGFVSQYNTGRLNIRSSLFWYRTNKNNWTISLRGCIPEGNPQEARTRIPEKDPTFGNIPRFDCAANQVKSETALLCIYNDGVLQIEGSPEHIRLPWYRLYILPRAMFRIASFQLIAADGHPVPCGIRYEQVTIGKNLVQLLFARG